MPQDACDWEELRMPGLTALIPLDGTNLSETAFSLLPFIKSLGIERVRLVSVWESDDEGGRKEDEPEVAEKGRAFLDAYLVRQAERVRAEGLAAEAMVKVGRAAESVLGAAGDTDLIVIATHGRTGIARWRLGSVADKVIRGAVPPVLVIGPNVKTELTSYALSRIMVPLDGSALSEEALPLAIWIAKLAGAELDLVRVVTMPTMAVDPAMGVYPVDLISVLEDAAEVYLEQKKEALAQQVSVSTHMRLGSPIEQLLEHLEERPAELVIIASHGRSGVARAALGSVADGVLHGPAPVLIFGPGVSEQNRLISQARSSIQA
jgi:nucleotide-binding universal stress UspA family protein